MINNMSMDHFNMTADGVLKVAKTLLAKG